jgi:hypothetical protein
MNECMQYAALKWHIQQTQKNLPKQDVGQGMLRVFFCINLASFPAFLAARIIVTT